MKKNYFKFLSALTFLFIGLSFSSCSSDDDNTNKETPQATPIEEVIKASTTGAVTTKGVDFNHANLKVEKVTLSEMVTVRSTGDKLSTLKVIFNDNVQVVINSLFFATDTTWWAQVLPAHIKYATDITFNLLKEDKTVAISETFTPQSNPKEWAEFMKSDGVQKFSFAFKGNYDYETTTEEGIHVDESNFEPELIEPKPEVPTDTLSMLKASAWKWGSERDLFYDNQTNTNGTITFSNTYFAYKSNAKDVNNITVKESYHSYKRSGGWLEVTFDRWQNRYYYIKAISNTTLVLRIISKEEYYDKKFEPLIQRIDITYSASEITNY